MKTRSVIAFFALVSSLASFACGQAASNAQALGGEPVADHRWGSGYMVLKPPVDFKAGDILRVKLGGTAKKVVLRLLPAGASPDGSTGVVGGALEVPPGGTIEVTLPEDRPQVGQISVHGGTNPWGEFPLGDGNGPATMISASVVRKR